MKKSLFIIILIIFISIVSVFISIKTFNVPNPISAGIGLTKILFTEKEYVQIQEYPKIYIAKSNNAQELLINFMKKKGYDYLEDERMASTLVFSNDVSKVYIDFSVNRYYSKWVFRE